MTYYLWESLNKRAWLPGHLHLAMTQPVAGEHQLCAVGRPKEQGFKVSQH
jgi:hypothetical protein